MIFKCSPKKVSIYVNTSKKTIERVKAETGCSAIINGGVFNWSWTPGCWLKADGKILASESWKAWGFGWNNSDVKMQLDDTGVSNFINCVALVKDGKAESLIYPSDMGGSRQRTAWAIMPDGSHFLYCSTSGMTPESLRDYFIRQGAKDALMLDGGGSTQCITPDGNVTSSRIVHNFICFWTEEETTMPSNIVDTILQKAKSQIGVKESPANSNNVKYNTDYYGKPVTGSAYPWCCAFIWWLFKECNATSLFYGGKKTASCTALMNYYKGKGQFSKTPRVGSLAFFNFDSNPDADHVGIVTAVNSGSVTTIEGNTATGNDSNGGEVMQRTRSGSIILGYAYPYEAVSGGATKVTVSLNVLKSGSKGENVKALQILLNGYGYNCGSTDGIYGAKTLTAVKTYQQKKGLTADGIVGANTWSKLLA